MAFIPHSPRVARCCLALFLSMAAGCTAITNPVADGVPARLAPPELLAPLRAHEVPLPLTLLRQPRQDTYRAGPGDTLGVYVEGFVGDRNQPTPIYVGDRVERPGERRLPPAVGFPIPVQENGTIVLPNVDPIPVQGLSMPEIRAAIAQVYVSRKLINERTDRVFVTLLQPRVHKVLVFREETLNPAQVNIVGIDLSKRGTGYLVDLPPGENDVLNALARTGGLPGQDSYDAVVVYRDCFRDARDGDLLLQQMQKDPAALLTVKQLSAGGSILRIPLRVPPKAIPPIKPPDIILQSGDVVYLEGRDNQVFFTGGLLPPGVFPMPRDFDLDALSVISYVHGPLYNGAFGGSNLSGALLAQGIGSPSPRCLVVLRRTPHGGHVPIVVDLRRAMRDPAERIRIVAGDLLVLQEMPGDAIARYLTQSMFNFDLVWTVIRSKNAAGVIDFAAPDRLFGNRAGTVNFVQP